MQRDETISHYYSLKPAQFHDLVELSIRQEWLDEMVETIVDIELRQPESLSVVLCIRFSGVQNLIYVPSEATSLHFGFIDIICIEDYGWEGIRYKAFETEQDTTFSLLCREVCAWCAPKT